jgi:PAS domain S-box-containing protein
MACLALATITARGDHATGYHAARAALIVGDNTERGVETARARHVFGLFNCHWLEPLEHGLAQAHHAYGALLRSGELEFACYTFFTSQAALLETATTLADLEAENRRALDFAGKTGNRHATESYTAFRGLIGALSADVAMEADEIPASNPMAACFHHTTRALAACLFGDDVSHAQHAEAAVRLAPYITGFYPTALINVLESLALLTRQRSGDRDPALAERVAANQDWLAARAAEAPANFGHLHDLVEAERLATAGRGTEAFPVYERAIRRAKAHQRPWHTALAVEKAARCYLALDLEHAGHRLLEHACTLYAEWGATRKSAALAAEFPFLQATLSGFRDAQPLFAAIQQLASLRSVPQLAAATAEILQKLSGATDGQILALDEQDQWMLKAGFSADGPPVRQTLEEAEKAAVVPATVVRLGLRLQHAVLSDDAVHDTRFAGDPRFRDLDRCAVLGVPVISRNRAVAFLVLENRRLRGAFTKDLAETIGMLCGQLAVSIENARLYRSLENKVEQRTRELRLVLDNIPIAVVATTLTSPAKITFINQHFIRIFGYTLEDIPTVAAWAEKAYPDDGYRREVFLEWDAAVFRAIEDKGRVESMEFQVTGKDGTKREIIFGAVVLEDRLLVSMTDVSERKKAERAIRSLREELQKTAYELTENIPVGTYTMVQPPDGGMAYFSFMSTRFLELTGLEPEEARADPMNAFACVHPDDHEEWVRKNAYVFEHKLPFKEECRVVIKGETRWITAESTPRDMPDGSVVWEGVLTDITARRLAEEALRQVTQRMQLAAAAAGIGFWSRDRESRIEEWDDQMFRIYGVSREDFDGRWEPLVHPDDLPVVELLTEEALTAGHTGEYEYRIVRPDGTVRHIRGMSVCASGPLGESSREIGVNFDITEEKEAARREKEFDLRHRRDLENKLKTSLTASAVAHEINQPLSTILLQSKMALESGTGTRDILQSIAAEAQRVVVTIDKMKTLLRNVQTDHRQIDLAEVVQSTLLYNKGLLARHNIRVVRTGLKKPCRIMGDDAQLQLALTNLLRNAVEAIEESQPEKREIAVAIKAGTETVELIVGDSGPGWSGAPIVETPLHTTKKGGTGIGLYVVRTAMENHRGEITFGPSPLGGAEVRLTFPRVEEKA